MRRTAQPVTRLTAEAFTSAFFRSIRGNVSATPSPWFRCRPAGWSWSSTTIPRGRLDEWWIWENGGGFFGVPLSNVLGWTFTVSLFMQVFALYLRYRGPEPATPSPRTAGDLTAVVLYAATTVTFLNNYLTRDRMPVPDPSGTTWQTGDIDDSSLLLAVYGMLFLALLATLRIAQRRRERGAADGRRERGAGEGLGERDEVDERDRPSATVAG